MSLLSNINLIEASVNYNHVFTNVTTVQKSALTNVEIGETVYQTDGDVGLYTYNGTIWEQVKAPTNNAVSSGILSTTESARVAMTGMGPGKMVFQTDGTDPGVYVYTGSVWTQLAVGSTSVPEIAFINSTTNLPTTGDPAVIYVAKDNGSVHYWNGTSYITMQTAIDAKANALNGSNVPVVYANSTTKIDSTILPSTVVYKDSNGKILASDLPAIAISNTFVDLSTNSWYANASAQVGDLTILSDISNTYIKSGSGTVLADWTQLLTPTGGISSITLANTSTPITSGAVTNVASSDHDNVFTVGQSLTNTTGNSITASRNISTAGQLVSSVVTGTAPITVASTTVVPNLNAEQVGGVKITGTPADKSVPVYSTANSTASWSTVVTSVNFANTGAATVGGAITNVARNNYDNAWSVDQTSTGSFTVSGTNKVISAPQLVSTVSGVAPLTVTSTTVVPNLNVARLNGTVVGNGSANAQLLLGTGSNTAEWKTVTGDLSVANTGAITVAKLGNIPLDLTNLQDKAALSWDAASATIKLAQVGSGGNSSSASLADTIVLRDANADIYANNYFSTSSRELKDNINSLSAANVLDLEPVQFTFKADSASKVHFGLIAEDVATIFPNLVGLSSEGVKSVNYIEIIALLLAKVKEQDNDIKSIKAQLGLL
jgi:hypothetical protein